MEAADERGLLEEDGRVTVAGDPADGGASVGDAALSIDDDPSLDD